MSAAYHMMTGEILSSHCLKVTLTHGLSFIIINDTGKQIHLNHQVKIALHEIKHKGSLNEFNTT